jgi:hypothetical protein
MCFKIWKRRWSDKAFEMARCSRVDKALCASAFVRVATAYFRTWQRRGGATVLSTVE